MSAEAVASTDKRATLGLVLAPVAMAALTLGYVHAVDPNSPGHYPVCPFRSVTGLYCPGCGTLRALHAVVAGQPGTALHDNVLTIAALPLLAWLWWRWARGRLTGVPPRPVPAAAIWVLLALVVGFGVVRNLPFGQALAP